jgi:hypothetical protein
MEAMPRVMNPFPFVLIAVAGWMNQRQQQAIDSPREENRVLREPLGERRLRLSDDQRRRLAAKAQGLGRKLLAEIATVVTPETLLAVSFPISCESAILIECYSYLVRKSDLAVAETGTVFDFSVQQAGKTFSR